MPTTQDQARGNAAGSGEPGRADARRPRARGPATLAIGLAGLAAWLAAGAGAGRLRSAEEKRNLIAARPSETEAVASALGGFRGLVSDFLWLRAIQMQDEGRFDEITLLCKLILDIQPRFAGVWCYQAWNLAYNLAYDSNTPQERWHWIRRGIDLLENERDGGIARNPGSWELPWELGNAYYLRLSRKGSDPLYRHYQEKLSPVPAWCGGEFDFVDQGLWGVVAVDGDGEGGRAAPARYRLYVKAFPAGRVTLGGASAEGGSPSRAARMYVVVVKPAGALARATRLAGGRSVEAGSLPLAPGAPLYVDAPVRVAGVRFPPALPGEPDEPPVPERLAGAAVVPLRDADRTLDVEAYLELELSEGADVWIGWPADESRNFEIARKWLREAERLSRGRFLMVSRLRIRCLVEQGPARWDEAHREFRELMASRPEADTSVPNAFRNFLLYAVYRSSAARDPEGVEKWHRRLRTEFPAWTMPPAETIEFMKGILGVHDDATRKE